MAIDPLALEELRPPPSLGRISAFLDEVTHTSAFQAMPDSAPPIGIGASAQDFAGEVLGRASFAGLLPVQKDRNALADKYSLQSRDVREFTQWLVKYRDRKEESENVVRIQVVEREGPERVVQGPPRDLTQAELEALIQQATKGRPAESAGIPNDAALQPSKSADGAPASLGTNGKQGSAGPTTEETREAVSFLNRGIWGSNLAFGSMIGGMAMGTPGYTPFGGPGVSYLMQGGGMPGLGGMAAYHGMPGAVARAAFMGSGATPYGGFALPSMVFDTAPGPFGMGVTPSPLAAIGEGLMLNPGLVPSARLGQMTLVAPPLQVASEAAQQAGSAVAFEWGALAKGAGQVDAGSLQMLRTVVPEGTAFVFPALGPSQLPAGAVNLNVTPDLSRQLMAAGYGVDDPLLATKSAFLALASSGGVPAVPLAGTIVPTSPPILPSAGVLGSVGSHPIGALGDAGAGQARRGGALDFLGVPVRLAPTLGATSEVQQERDVRAAIADPTRPTVIRPDQFGPLKNNLFTAFQSVHAEPNKQAWQKAAPTFGLRDAEPATVLGPDSRIKMPHGGGPIPQTDGTSDPLGRSIGLASKTAGLLEQTQAARATPGAPIPGASTAGAGPPAFTPPDLTHVSGGQTLGPDTQNRLAFGGTAMSNFGQPMAAPTGSFSGSPASAVAPHIGPVTPRLAQGPKFGGAAPSATAVASAALPSGPVSPARNLIGGRSPRSAPAHLPLLGKVGSSLMPSAIRSATSSLGPARPSGPAMTISHSPPLVPSAPTFDATSLPLVPTMTPAATTGSGSTAKPSASPARQRSQPARPSRTPPPSPTSMPSFGLSSPNFQPSSAPIASTTKQTQPQSMPIARATPSAPHTSTVINTHVDLPLRMPPTPVSEPAPAMAIQAATERATTPAETTHDARSESRRTSEVGHSAHEVNLLAREVWSLLKRRMHHDAERLGIH